MRSFTGTLTLTRLALKRDRIQLPVWILAIAGLMAAFPAIYDSQFPTPPDLAAATEVFAGNPVMRMFGLPSGADLGAYVLVRSFVIISVVTGLMSVLTVVRHTRQSEEARQAEMLGSMVVGRHSGLAAALIVVGLANVALALLISAAFMLYDLPVASSFAAGVAVGAVGVSYGGIAAITAQLSSSSRGASGLAVGAIGAAFLVSAAGTVLGTARPSGVEVDPAWPIWLSPIGWAQLMRPFGEDNWWPLLLVAVAFASLSAVAFALIDRRDVGRGILAEGRGPANASPSLLSPVGLAWRLQRSVFLGWAIGVVATGLVLGAIVGDIEETLADLDSVDLVYRVGGTDQLIDAFFVMALGWMGPIISAFTVQTLLRMRVEEAEGPLESVLAAAVSRPRWLLSYAVIAVLGTVALLVLFGASAGLAAGLSLGNLGTWLPDLTLAGLVQAPAALVIAGVAVVAFAVLPSRAAGLSWAAFVVALIAGPTFGELLELPQLLRDLSPFTHVPSLPAAAFDAVPLALLLGVAALLAAGGFANFRRRDLALH